METSTTYWPLALYFALTVLTVAALGVLSYILGERHMERTTAEPYESGIAATGSTRVRVDVKYYLVAMFFVIFDLEAVFVFAWAISLREPSARPDGRGTWRCSYFSGSSWWPSSISGGSEPSTGGKRAGEEGEGVHRKGMPGPCA
jgi:NADH:ubiquinone oxidoreductase subunit 3 (subunit A)